MKISRKKSIAEGKLKNSRCMEIKNTLLNNKWVKEETIRKLENT